MSRLEEKMELSEGDFLGEGGGFPELDWKNLAVLANFWGSLGYSTWRQQLSGSPYDGGMIESFRLLVETGPMVELREKLEEAVKRLKEKGGDISGLGAGELLQGRPLTAEELEVELTNLYRRLKNFERTLTGDQVAQKAGYFRTAAQLTGKLVEMIERSSRVKDFEMFKSRVMSLLGGVMTPDQRGTFLKGLEEEFQLRDQGGVGEALLEAEKRKEEQGRRIGEVWEEDVGEEVKGEEVKGEDAGEEVRPTGKKRGRPSKAELAARELAAGSDDPLDRFRATGELPKEVKFSTQRRDEPSKANGKTPGK